MKVRLGQRLNFEANEEVAVVCDSAQLVLEEVPLPSEALFPVLLARIVLQLCSFCVAGGIPWALRVVPV